ncbi:hypothetical protein [Staphylococcus chromogenes]|nr:hypothetical protein [Staphylococcus chromogenes]
MKIYDKGSTVYIQTETELEAEVIRSNSKNLERQFDEMVSEAIKKRNARNRPKF